MKRLAAAGLLAGTMLSAPAYALVFTPGDLVVSVEGNGVWGASSGSYTDNQAAPLTLMEFTASGQYVGSEALPQTASNGNFAVSGEYGSSSEGMLQLSGNGAYLTVMGYGVNAAAFNANPAAYGTDTTGSSKSTALGQSGSLTVAQQKASGLSGAQLYTPVARVAALINSNGSVNSTTGVYNVFNGNNPRSVYSANGTSFYISGQGDSPDTTGGVFYLPTRGATASPVQITGQDTQSGSSTPYDSNQDTRFVTEYNGTLYVSTDSKEGKNNARSFIGTLGSPPATSTYFDPSDTTYNGTGPTMLNGFGNSGGTGKVTITAATSNGLNSGKQVNLSPEEFYFASSTVMYVADSGDSKQTSASSTLGDGGLQKWVNVGGTWTLEYTLGLNAGLPLVANTSASGTSGLFAVTGEYDAATGDEELFVTTYSLTDTGATYLYEITDALDALSRNTTSGSGLDEYTLLDTAPADSNFKGVSFAPTVFEAVPEPAGWALMLAGVGFVGASLRRRREMAAA
jgi:PEP-CTERM motif